MAIGFIGLGNLGTPIAENLLTATGQLYVYNRTASKAQALIEKGAVLCSSVKELSGLCNIVFSIVSDDAALNHITLGEEGIAANLEPDGVHISMSTVLPQTSTLLAEEHIKYNNYYITCPVMGRPEAARAQKLNFLISGNAPKKEGVTELLRKAGGLNIFDFGEDVAAANVAKLCTNYLIIAAIEAMAESINLANNSGIDGAKWITMMQQTLFASPIYNNYGNILLKQSFQPASFALRLGLKDVNLVLQQAVSSNTAMPFAGAVQQQLMKALQQGLGDYDWTAVALALQPSADVARRDEAE